MEVDFWLEKWHESR